MFCPSCFFDSRRSTCLVLRCDEITAKKNQTQRKVQ